MLMDFYGALLSERQQQIVTLYHEENCSLQEISEELEKMAQQYGMEKEKLMEMIGPQNLSMIGGDLKVRKAVDFMYDNAVKK